MPPTPLYHDAFFYLVTLFTLDKNLKGEDELFSGNNSVLHETKTDPYVPAG